MPVMDEFKAEREAMKHGTPKQKLAYFWDYYKWYVIGGIAVIALLASLIYQFVTRKETAFYAIMLNASSYNFMEDTSENTAAFAEYAGIDESMYQILYDTSIQIGTEAADDYNSSQKLMVYIAAGELDVMVSDADSLTRYAHQGNFKDMRDFLTEEQLEKYADSFYYIDNAVVKEIEAANEIFDLEFVPNYKNPHHPEEMQEPVPTGIFVNEDCPLLKDYYFRGEDVAVSVFINTERPELASAFIDFLMQ